MKKILSIGMVILMILSLSACGAQTPTPPAKIEGSPLFVKQVENLSADFILGMDASSVPSLEASGVKFYDFDGTEQDVFQTLAENGINYIRVRVWNDPFDEKGNGYGGGNCSIDTAIAIGQRATQYGMKLLVNFHYSDFWADPGKQMVPKAWAGMSIKEKTDALYRYTLDCLKKLKEAKVDVGMVQIGNETNGKLCGESDWENMCALFSAGAKAVRRVFPRAKVALHFANPETANRYCDYAAKLDTYKVDYDIFASSYYPFWHGTLQNLRSVLTKINEQYGKNVLVMETSYAYTPEDTDFNGNTISDGSNVTKNYPYTVQGQANAVRDVIETVASIPGGMGVFYWEGTWITVGRNSWEENSAKWEKYGSGWASSYASGYDPNDAGKYYGGSAVDNQALFGPDGKPLESLRIFNLVRYGNDGEIKADDLQDEAMTVLQGSPIALPGQVSAIMTDGSEALVDVVWDADEAKLASISAAPGKYELTGSAAGMRCTLRITVEVPNLVQNGDFETGDLTPWRVTDLKKADQLYNENKPGDSLSGNYHLHFWSAARDSMEFTAEQDVTGLAAGTYQFSISIMGGDGGETEIYAYAKVNGTEVGRAPMQITTYGNWDTGLIEGITVRDGDTLTVGIYVKCAGSGNGAWGKIDSAALNIQN